MDKNGLYGPFQNPDDIEKLWYQVTEKELEDWLEQAKIDLEDAKRAKEDITIYKQDVKRLSEELNNLRNFIDDYARCLERYKYDKEVLEQVQNDWWDYNFSLYLDWNSIQIAILNPNQDKGEDLENSRKEAKLEEIKREEIERRIRILLDKTT